MMSTLYVQLLIQEQFGDSAATVVKALIAGPRGLKEITENCKSLEIRTVKYSLVEMDGNLTLL